MMEFYWTKSPSHFAWRCALFILEIKQVHFKSCLIQEPPLPMLKDGSYVLHDPFAIMHYIDVLYPKAPLFGKNARDRGRIIQMVNEIKDKFGNNFLEANRVVKNLEIEGSDLYQELQKELQEMDIQLEKSPFLVGVVLTCADCLFLPILSLLLEVYHSPLNHPRPFEQQYPFIAQWLKRIREYSAYRRYSRHFKENSKRERPHRATDLGDHSDSFSMSKR